MSASYTYQNIWLDFKFLCKTDNLAESRLLEWANVAKKTQKNKNKNPILILVQEKN